MTRAASFTLAVGLTLMGCDESKTPAVAPSRVEAISARKSDDSAASFCDVAPAAGTGLRFSFPRLEGPTPSDVKGFRWVNLWATWCAPCVEELPRLAQLSASLKSAGANVTLQLVSVDTTASAVEVFTKGHPEVTGSPRLADPMALQPWLGTIGLDQGATLPVHVFVAPDGKVACARTGAIRDSDLPALKKLLGAR